MEKLYWLSVVGNIAILVWVVILVIIVSMFFYFLTYIINSDEVDFGIFKKSMKIMSIVLAISSILVVFIPSEKQMYVIYGIGGTIDYIENNEDAKQLPDKAIKALELFLDKENE